MSDFNKQVEKMVNELKSTKNRDLPAQPVVIDREAMYRDIAAENAAILRGIYEHSCEVCNGTGQVVIEGHMSYCPLDCAATVKLRRDNLVKQLRRYGEIPDNYADFTFDTWFADVSKTQRNDKQLAFFVLSYFVQYGGGEFSLYDVLTSGIVEKHVKDGLKVEIVRDPETEQLTMNLNGVPSFFYSNSIGNSVCLAGDYGFGKTGLCVAAAKHLMDSGIGVAFVHLPSLLRDTRTAYENSKRRDKGLPPVEHGKTYDELMTPIRNAPVLLVDDFNLPSDATPNDMRVVEVDIIETRYSKRMPTLITTNHTQDSFESQWGRRASERVFEKYHWVELKGQAIRRRNRPNT